jgi:hypothetical protein
MSNPWVLHVKDYAKKNDLSYMCAMSQPACKASYKKPTPVKKIKTIEVKPTTVPKAVVVKPMTVPKVVVVTKPIEIPKLSKYEIYKNLPFKPDVYIPTKRNKYLSDYLGITKNSDTTFVTDSSKKNKLRDQMFDIIDNEYTKEDMYKFMKNPIFNTTPVFDRARDFYDKKIEQQKNIQYQDFVSLVIYPAILKNIHLGIKITDIALKFKLLLYANEIANEPMFEKAKPRDKGSIVMQFLSPKTTGGKQLLSFLGDDFKKLFNEYVES